MNAIPNVLRVDLTARQKLRHFSARGNRRVAPNGLQHASGRAWVARSRRNPVRRKGRQDVLGPCRIFVVGLILESIAVHAAVRAEVEQSQDQRPQSRLRMTPADRLQCAPSIGGEYGLVPDVAVVPRAVTPQSLDDFVAPLGAGQRRDGAVRSLLVPRLHRGMEFSPCLSGRWQLRLRRAQAEVILVEVPLLRFLEVIKCPKQRQQAFVFGGVKAQLVHGVQHKDAMELETRRLGTDVPDSG